MSYVNPAILKGLEDPSLSFFTTTIAFATAVLQIDSLSQHGAYIKAFRIVNNDAIAPLTYVQGQLSEPAKTVPISSAENGNGWESFIQITPNAVSGSGYIELDLIPRRQAER